MYFFVCRSTQWCSKWWSLTEKLLFLLYIAGFAYLIADTFLIFVDDVQQIYPRSDTDYLKQSYSIEVGIHTSPLKPKLHVYCDDLFLHGPMCDF